MKKISSLISILKKHYPNPECALHHNSSHELLIATILSAQCTDERVNQVTPLLFETYPTIKDLAQAPVRKIETLIHSTGFYKNKAKNIKACCQRLIKVYNSEVPQTLEDLTSLAGVGRKTANVVLGNAFGIASGVVVDTHVTRLSYRMGLIQTRNPIIAERKLNELIAKKHWIHFSHWLILHGRQICKARNPQCEICPLKSHCPKLDYKLK